MQLGMTRRCWLRSSMWYRRKTRTRSDRSRWAAPAASSSTDSTSFSLAGQWAQASSCSPLLALLSSSAGSCCDCWFTGEFLSLPWHLFLLDVFYLDSRGGNCCRAEEDKDEKRPNQVGSACSLFLKRFDQLLPCSGQWAPASSCSPLLALLLWLLVHRRVFVSSLVSFPVRCVLSWFQGGNCCCAVGMCQGSCLRLLASLR